MSDQTILWNRLRVMPNSDGLQDDPDWRGLQQSPHTLTAVVGGTASNGVYSITIAGSVVRPNGSVATVNETISMTRTSETNAQIAAALDTDADANTVLTTAGITADDSSTTLTLTFPPGAFVTLTGSAPGTGTLTFPLGTSLPILGSAPHYGGSRYHLGGVIVIVNALDGDTLLAPGTSTQTTFDMELVEVALVRRETSSGPRLETRIASTATLSGCELAAEYVFPVRGAGYFTVRLSNFADPVANTDGYEVVWRDGAS